MKSVSIGLLLPNSTIMPMSRDFEKGMKRALKELTDSNEWEVEIIPEFIAEGSKEKADQAINKFISYHDVDVVSGILSNKAVAGLAEKFEKSNKAFLFNNIGEHVPDPRQLNEYVYINSINIWQQIWSLGKWGVGKFGKKGMFVSGLYDAGYSFSMMLQMGMQAADPDAVMPFAVAPVSAPGALADVVSVFQHIETFAPDFIFATFCGEEASIFLKEYIRRGLHEKIPLLGLPFLLQPFDSNGEEIVVYTTFSLTKEMEYSELHQVYEANDSPFSLLGYESGMMLKEAVLINDAKQLKQSLNEVNVDSLRGRLNIVVAESGQNSNVYLLKNTFNGGNTVKEIISGIETISINNDDLLRTLDQPSSGWYNPYPAV